jgi:hypothetical protein
MLFTVLAHGIQITERLICFGNLPEVRKHDRNCTCAEQECQRCPSAGNLDAHTHAWRGAGRLKARRLSELSGVIENWLDGCFMRVRRFAESDSLLCRVFPVPLDGFSRNLTFEDILKIRREISSFNKV